MFLGLEMTKRVDKYFVKVHFHRITTEYSSWLVDKVADKEADMVAMRKQFLIDNRERHDDENYEFKRSEKDDKIPSIEDINDQPKVKKLRKK